ncbi:MAG: hypothetical protein IKP35_00130 [Alphaproteobacteria bacterium]|nr:hypothetical protein [Alphaproteobacteria bacterium]MBR6009814.1 hypothetical protein [Alphaproteobacteria bacterium]
MAFQNKNLSVIAYANGFTLWHYKESATLATIIASGYFSSVKTLMNTGDIILINGSDGATIKAITVAEGVVTVGALS